MPRYIAFLRAINVGGHIVKMAQLRTLFDALGFSGVETFIASGNVIFDSSSRSPAALEKRLAAHLEKALGYPVATFLRTPDELSATAAHQAFDPADVERVGATVFITFLGATVPAAARTKVEGLGDANNVFRAHGREVYWLRRRRIEGAPFSGASVERACGMAGTMRNLTTVKKLAAKYAGAVRPRT